MKRRYSNSLPTTGVHLLAELTGCSNRKLGQLHSAEVQNSISQLVKRSGFTELGHFYYEFKGGGLTGIVALRESHIAFHTWPELGYVTLDVYLCNYRKDNREAANLTFRRLCNLFPGGKVRIRKIPR